MRQILFQIGKKLLRRVFRCCIRLMERLFEPHAVSRVIPAFQIGQNFRRIRPQIWTAFTSLNDDHVEKVLAEICQNRRLTVRDYCLRGMNL